MSQAGTVRLSWETKASTKDPQPYLIKYTILYHRDGDISHNQVQYYFISASKMFKFNKMLLVILLWENL